MNILVRQIMWVRPDEAKQYLDEALKIPAIGKSAEAEQIQTIVTMGHFYLIKKQPENAMEVWLPLMDREEVHPAHRCSIGYQIGLIYKQMGDLENARKYLQMAVEAGKKVKYKFDYSAPEKALEALSK